VWRRGLAAAMAKLPGFIAYALLDDGGSLLAIAIFERQADLAAAQGVAEQWDRSLLDGQPFALAEVSEAEVVVQKGL